MYYFPSPIVDFNFPKKISPELVYTFNSGKNALRFLLRHLNLMPNSKIAIPSYVCNDVKDAVISESLLPVLFDLKDDKSFWTQYDFVRLKHENIKAVILVHMYGFVHPDTKQIIDFCSVENISLIHDAAQSFGINEEKLGIHIPVIYSFGAGKALTAAGGGWIRRVELPTYHKNVTVPSIMSFKNIKARYFLRSRIFNLTLSKTPKIINAIVNSVGGDNSDISVMATFQKQAASFILGEIGGVNTVRKKNYKLLKDAVENNGRIMIAYDDTEGVYFKVVVFVEHDPDGFRSYLRKSKIPCFSLFKDDGVVKYDTHNLSNHRLLAHHFVEISCESSIPENEIIRVAQLLRTY